MSTGTKALTCSLNLSLVSLLTTSLLMCKESDGIPGLNYRLQKAGSTVTVVAFIIMPAATHSYTVEALKGQAVIKQLHDTVTEVQNRIGARLFDHAARFHG